MSDAERMAAMLGGIGVVIATLLMGLGSKPPLPALDRERPLVGRTRSDVSAGPPSMFRHIRRATDADRERDRKAAVLLRFDKELVRNPWPEGLERVVVHPVAGALPTVNNEDGPPWHIVVAPDGTVSPTPRLLKGLAGAPPGLPAQAALDAVHVAVPFAATETPSRRTALLDLFDWLIRRLGRKTSVLLVIDVTGATATLPDGVARKGLLPEK